MFKYNIYRSYNFLGVFSDPELFFCFLCSSYQKKVRAVRSFPPQNQSKLANQTGKNHCDLAHTPHTVTRNRFASSDHDAVWSMFDIPGLTT